MVARFEKVVSTLPNSITPDTLYAVRVNQGFDLYISNSSGAVAQPLNAQVAARLPPPTLYEQNDTYFYFGWASLNGGWSVRRQRRATAEVAAADLTYNSSKSSLTAAWAAREDLVYLRLIRPELAGKNFYVDPDEPDCVSVNGSGHVTGVRDLVSGHVVLVPDPAGTGTITAPIINGKRCISLDGQTSLIPAVPGSLQLHGRSVYASAKHAVGGFGTVGMIHSSEGLTIAINNRTRLQVNGGYNLLRTTQSGNANQWLSLSVSLQSNGVQYSWANRELANGTASRVQSTNDPSLGNGGSSAFTVTKIGPNAAGERLDIGLMFSVIGNAETMGTNEAHKALINHRTKILEGV